MEVHKSLDRIQIHSLICGKPTDVNKQGDFFLS